MAVLTVLRLFAAIIVLGTTVLAITCAEEIDASTPTRATREAHFPEVQHWRAIALERGLNEAGKIEDPYRRAVTFAGIARARARADEPPDPVIRQALTAASAIPDATFRGWAMHDITLAQLAANDVYGAQQTAMQVDARDPRSAALLAVAEARLRRSDLAGARAIAQRLEERDEQGELLRQLVVAHLARGQISAARALLPRIRDAFHHARALADIADLELRSGHPDRALALAKEAKRSERDLVYERLALVQADMGDLSGAQSTLRQIRDDLRRPFAQARVLVVAKSSDSAALRDSVAKARRAAERSKDPEQGAMALARLVRLQLARGDRSFLHETMSLASTLAGRLSPGPVREETLDYIARTYLRADEIERAIELASRLDDRVIRALLVRDIVARRGGETVDSTAASVIPLQDPLMKTAAQFGALGSQLTRRGGAVSRETVEAAADAVRSLEEARLKPAAFAALAAAQAWAGDTDAAAPLFEEALLAAERILEAEARARAYLEMTEALDDRLVFLGQPAPGGAREARD
ncbi:MAG TPA: hypothetical protein VF161_07670 [Steroidobacteraceae bacterium]